MPAENRGQMKLIEVRLKNVAQLFNSMDPSPFHEKDLDRNAEDFITSWAMEFPLEQPLALAVHVENMQNMDEATRTITEAVHHFFAYRAELKTRELRELLRRGRTSLVIGLTFLVACLLAGRAIVSFFGETALASIVQESLLIGGWVAMWRPLEIFLYDWWPIRHMRRTYKRLSEIEVRVDTVAAG